MPLQTVWSLNIRLHIELSLEVNELFLSFQCILKKIPDEHIIKIPETKF